MQNRKRTHVDARNEDLKKAEPGHRRRGLSGLESIPMEIGPEKVE